MIQKSDLLKNTLPWLNLLYELGNVLKLLQLIEIICLLIMIDLCDAYGMMECWNNGIVVSKSGKRYSQ